MRHSSVEEKLDIEQNFYFDQLNNREDLLNFRKDLKLPIVLLKQLLLELSAPPPHPRDSLWLNKLKWKVVFPEIVVIVVKVKSRLKIRKRASRARLIFALLV